MLLTFFWLAQNYCALFDGTLLRNHPCFAQSQTFQVCSTSQLTQYCSQRCKASLLTFSVVTPSPHKSAFDLRGPYILQCSRLLVFFSSNRVTNCTSLFREPLFLQVPFLRCPTIAISNKKFSICKKVVAKLLTLLRNLYILISLPKVNKFFIVYVGLCANVVKYGSTLNNMFSVGYFFCLVCVLSVKEHKR